MYELTATGLKYKITHWFGICEGIVLLQPRRSSLSYLCHWWILRKHRRTLSMRKTVEEKLNIPRVLWGIPQSWCVSLTTAVEMSTMRVTTLHYSATWRPNNPLYSKCNRPIIQYWQRRDDSNNFHGKTSINNHEFQKEGAENASGRSRNIKRDFF